MFKNLTYKNKFIVLIGMFFLGLLLIYQVSVKQTLRLSKSCKEINSKIQQVETAPLQISKIKNELNDLDDFVKNTSIENYTFQDFLMDFVSVYCKTNNIVLREFPETHKIIRGNYVVETFSIILEGKYSELLKFLYSLETDFNEGSVVSIKFNTLNDLKYHSKKLYLTVYIQNIENEKN